MTKLATETGCGIHSSNRSPSPHHCYQPQSQPPTRSCTMDTCKDQPASTSTTSHDEVCGTCGNLNPAWIQDPRQEIYHETNRYDDRADKPLTLEVQQRGGLDLLAQSRCEACRMIWKGVSVHLRRLSPTKPVIIASLQLQFRRGGRLFAKIHDQENNRRYEIEYYTKISMDRNYS